jgi:hypothetical protein
MLMQRNKFPLYNIPTSSPCRRMHLRPLLLPLVLLVISGCKYFSYSLREGNIAPEVKTISIGYIENNASVVVPQLSQQLTDKLRQKYLSETRLSLVNSEGDYDIKGRVTAYISEPIALQAGQTASKNQLRITMQVQFTNVKNAKASFSDSFTQYAEYPSSSSLASVELQLINEISEKLVQAIFNRTLSDW